MKNDGITITIENFDKIRATFEKKPAKMLKELGVAIEKVLIKVNNTAMREAPVNKQSGGGNLRQSIHYSMTGVASGRVEVTGAGGSPHPYAVFVHEGTRPHIIRVAVKKTLANKRTGQIFGKVVRHPGTKANPFLQRAVDQENDFINRTFDEAIANTLAD